jgi:putative resolvase
MCVFVSDCVPDSAVNLAAWARSVGLHPQTVYAWVRGVGCGCRSEAAVGTILVEVAPAAAGDQCVVPYARVSSHDQHADLDRSVARLKSDRLTPGWMLARWWLRPGLARTINGRHWPRILSDPSAKVIVVEHRDRLARVGPNIFLPRFRRSGAGSRSLTMVKPTMIWCAT